MVSNCTRILKSTDTNQKYGAMYKGWIVGLKPQILAFINVDELNFKRISSAGYLTQMKRKKIGSWDGVEVYYE